MAVNNLFEKKNLSYACGYHTTKNSRSVVPISLLKPYLGFCSLCHPQQDDNSTCQKLKRHATNRGCDPF